MAAVPGGQVIVTALAYNTVFDQTVDTLASYCYMVAPTGDDVTVRLTYSGGGQTRTLVIPSGVSVKLYPQTAQCGITKVEILGALGGGNCYCNNIING